MNEINQWRVQMQPWGGETRWHLLDPQGEVVPEAERFLHTLMLRGLAPRTRRTYAYDLLCAYRWMEENDLHAEQIGGEDMLGFIAYQQQPPPAAPSTINRRLRLLQRLVAFLTGTTPLIPAWQHQGQALHFHARSRRGSLRLKEPHRVVHPLSDAQVLKFVGSLKSWRDRLIVLLMWAEGLRSMEVLNLCLTDIDLHHGSLHIEGKGRKQRVMPLAEPVAKVLLLYVRLERPRTTSPRLLLVLKGPHRGRPLSPEGLRNTFRYHRAKSGVAQANPHRFRHSFGANMTRCRVPLLVLARMMGHSSPHTTMRYVELEDEELRQHFQQALDALAPRGLLDAPEA
jgi:site-specific recombinase XerD